MRGMLWEAAGAAASAGACSMAWAVRGRSSSVFGRSVWRGVRDRRSVALTFDDGPSESTPELLDLLAGLGVPATFFLCGINVRRLPEVARETALRGHEIGNHSDTHARFWLRPAAFIRDQVTRAQDSITEVTGVAPVLFRAPYGVRWFGLGGVQRELGLTGVMWTASGLDWRLPAARICRRLARGASNGAIFCLHDAREGQSCPDIRPTLEAVRRLVPELRARGYRFETVSQILCRCTGTPRHTHMPSAG
ncbi:MAG TPA: polysaccharide deacetylase family protein [Bryobacteraceae bacterium]|nr:polysaccharide deacetylase family protein [Bryobacteraceae bacterium]